MFWHALGRRPIIRASLWSAPAARPAPVAGLPELAAELAAQEPGPPRADPAEQRGGGRTDDQHVAKGNQVVGVGYGHGLPPRRGTRGEGPTLSQRELAAQPESRMARAAELTPAVSRSKVSAHSCPRWARLFPRPSRSRPPRAQRASARPAPAWRPQLSRHHG